MDDNFNIKKLKYSEENRLDLEFRQILCVIKQFIPYVNSNSNLTTYRCWLERLSSEQSDKTNRNRYLIELAKQIKDNIIASPFDENPNLGPLKSFTEFESSQELTTQKDRKVIKTLSDTYDSSDNVCIPHRSPIKYFQTVDFYNCYVPSQETSKNIGTVFKSHTEETDCNIRPKNRESCKKLEEDSSWLDLTTDTSLASIQVNANGAGDAEDKYIKSIMEENQNQDSKKNINKEEPLNGKMSLKYTNFIPADWKETIEALQLRLTETLNQNDELKRIFEAQNSTLSYEIKTKEYFEAELKKHSELHEKEIEMLKTANENAIKKLENSFQMELNEVQSNYQCKMEEIKTNYERQVIQLKIQCDNEVTMKDKEIYRLSEIIQQQCSRLSNEIIALRKHVEISIVNSRVEEKVVLLQKCVSKLDKLYHKSEKEYLKQIDKLKQDMELKEKVQLIQMKTQRAELAMQSNIERQKQIDEIINNLEVKYIKMLEYHEQQVSESKRLDDERLTYLKDLLERHNIPFKVF